MEKDDSDTVSPPFNPEETVTADVDNEAVTGEESMQAWLELV